MKAKKEQELITSLIIDDIVNSMLIAGLEKLGLDVDVYHLSVNHIVFQMMGYKDPDDEHVYEGYLALKDKTVETYTKADRQVLEMPAHELYQYLCRHRPKRKR